MFGRMIERYCPNCKENIKYNVSVGFRIDGKNYYNVCFCSKCDTDLAEEDRTVIKKAKDDGKEIVAMMY